MGIFSHRKQSQLFINYSYDYRPYWPSLSPIIINDDNEMHFREIQGKEDPLADKDLWEVL